LDDDDDDDDDDGGGGLTVGSGGCRASLQQDLLGPVELLVMRDGLLECNWESTDGQSKTALILLLWSKVKDVLRDLDR
jgi:hypothetical protein